MRVRLHPEARAELRDARRWYYERSPLSATAFAHAVDNAVTRISEAPNSFPLADHGTRKFILQRFPFNLFYRWSETEVVIVAVAHQKRRPGYWSDRTTSRSA
jgi:plasmid stabilization system protein ParE